jgi:transglutaminase-like putative cysteine protease
MERTPGRLKDSVSAILLILLMLVSSQRLYSTNWTDGLGTVLVLSFLGTVVGLGLGSSKFKSLAVTLLALGYSLVMPLLIILWDLYQNVPWMDRLISLGSQLATSMFELVTAQPVRESTLFVVFMCLVYWFITLIGGYKLMRSGNFSAAIVPAGIVLIIIQLFDMQVGDHVYILAIYGFLSLLLLGRLNFVRQRDLWKEERVLVSADSVTDMNILFSAASVALIILAWIAPVSGRPLTSARILWENITRPVRDRQEELNRTIQSLQSDQVNAVSYYGDSLDLGRQAQTGNDTYLKIRAPLVRGAKRYYWRVRTYDDYQNDQWSTNFVYDEPFLPTQESLSIADPEGITAEFIFTTPNDNISVLVTPPRPIWISRASQLTFTPSFPGRIDPIMFVANTTILAGQSYLVHANIYEPTAAQLREAGMNYPAWVSDHYLELPSNLPPEIKALAQQITTGLETPYDKAAAITEYLRTNIKYSTTIGTPPPGVDTLAWFLFDSKTGFCNYYATAEVIMLRSLGIPARMAVGFAQGEYEAPNQYTVRPKDAHAWPEVYFPENGWVEFEPTSSQPPLVRAAGGNGSADQTPTPASEGTPEGNNSQETPIPVEGSGGPGSGITHNPLLRLTVFFLLAILLVGGAFIAYTFGVFDKILARLRLTFQKPLPVVLKNGLENLSLTTPPWLVHWAFLSELTPAERAFAVVYQSLHRLGKKPAPAQTPAEAAAELGRLIPESSGEINLLLEQVERSLYSRRATDLSIVHETTRTIRRSSRRAAIRARGEVFRSIFKGIFKPKRNIHTS